MNWFESSKQIPSKDCLRIAQISDLHLLVGGEKFHGIDSTAYLCSVLKALTKQQWDLIVVTGDITQDHTEASYQLLSQLCKEYLPNTPIARIPGNHDEIDSIAQWLSEPPFISCNHVILGDWHLLLLNSKGPEPSGLISTEHFDAIERVLSSINTGHCVGLFVHHHPLPMNAYIDKHILVNGLELLQQVAKHEQVRFLAHGHVHQQQALSYARQNNEDIAVLATPSTSMQFVAGSMERGNDDLGPAYRVFELDRQGRFTTDVVWLEKPKEVNL